MASAPSQRRATRALSAPRNRQVGSRRPSGQSGRGLRSVVLVASLLVLAVWIPVGLTSLDWAPRSDAWPIMVSVMVWAGIRLSFIWVNGEQRLFDFFVWLFVYIFMGLAPSVQMITGLVSTTTPGVDQLFDIPSALVVVAGLVAYELGRVGWILRERAAAPGLGDQRPPTQISARRAWLLMGAGVLASVYYISKVGVGAALGSREAAASARAAAWDDTSTRAVALALAIYPMLVGIGCLSQLRGGAQTAISRRLCTAGMIGGSAVLLLIVNPVASARYTFGTVLFGLAAFAGSILTARRARITMAATIVGFLALFPIADAFRRTTVSVSRDGFYSEYMSNGDYDAFWQIANALDYWLAGYVEPFRQLLGSLFFWVPRSVWPDKPVDTGVLLAQFRGYSFENLSAPMWAELLVNGGTVAVVLGFLALGASLRAFDTKLVTALAGPGGLSVIAGAIFPVYLTILMRGSWLQATGAMAVALACLWFVADRTGQGQAPRSRRRMARDSDRDGSPVQTARE